MSRSTARSPKELAVLALLGLFALLCLIFVLVGALVPDKATGQLAVQNSALALGPLIGSLGAMAMIWLRKRGRPAGGPLALAGALWMIGATLLGFGIFTAFTPGDRTMLTNLGYSIALCLTPGAIFSLLGWGTFWYSRRRQGAQDVQDAQGAQDAETAQVPAAVRAEAEPAPGYAEISRRAAEYHRRIDDLIREKRRVVYAGLLAPITEKLGTWEQQINRLIGRLRAFDADAVLQRDLREVPAHLARLEGQADAEQDPQVRLQMLETLAGLRVHQAQLDALVSLMRKTRLQLDQTLSAMGTIYSQLQMLEALGSDSARARQITQDVEEQVSGLSDLLAAMADVYGGAEEPSAASRPARGRPAAARGA